MHIFFINHKTWIYFYSSMLLYFCANAFHLFKSFSINVCFCQFLKYALLVFTTFFT